MSIWNKLLHFDHTALLYVRKWHFRKVTHVMKGLTRLADPTSFIGLGLLLLATGTPTGLRLGSRLGAASLLATLVTQVLKRLLKRRRPNVRIAEFEALAENPDAFSFPSGHTAAAFSVALALSGVSPTLTAFCLFLALGVGTSRVYLGAHYPLDVLVGCFLGTMSGVVSHHFIP